MMLSGSKVLKQGLRRSSMKLEVWEMSIRIEVKVNGGDAV
jgi:hypothetical protein